MVAIHDGLHSAEAEASFRSILKYFVISAPSAVTFGALVERRGAFR
jgi:hypothetical protein